MSVIEQLTAIVGTAAVSTDPDVLDLFAELRRRDIRIGVLSNTIWPREWHEDVFARDGVLHLHGYDIETKVEPGAVAEMAFAARATGRFPVEEHKPDAKGGHSHGEAPLVRIEVRPR